MCFDVACIACIEYVYLYVDLLHVCFAICCGDKYVNESVSILICACSV